MSRVIRRMGWGAINVAASHTFAAREELEKAKHRAASLPPQQLQAPVLPILVTGLVASNTILATLPPPASKALSPSAPFSLRVVTHRITN